MQKREGTLRRELSFIEAIALSIGIMAPTAAMALNGSLAAGITGSAVPLAFLLAAVAVGLASFSFIQFSRYFAHSGSVYGFNGVALGPRAGFFSGWAYLGLRLQRDCVVDTPHPDHGGRFRPAHPRCYGHDPLESGICRAPDGAAF